MQILRFLLIFFESSKIVADAGLLLCWEPPQITKNRSKIPE
jgi:hypothetical protein